MQTPNLPKPFTHFAFASKKDLSVKREALLFLLLSGEAAAIFLGGLLSSPTLLCLSMSFLLLPFLWGAPRQKGDGFLLFFLLFLVATDLGRGAEGLLRVPLALAFFLPRRLMARNQRHLASVLLLWGISSALLALLQLLTGRGALGFSDASLYALPRASALLGNPNLLAAALAALFPLSLSLPWQRGKRLAALLCPITLALGLAATGARMPLLAAGAAGLLTLLWRTPSPHTWLCLLPGAPVLLPEGIFHRLFGFLSGRETSGGYRLMLWKSLFRLPSTSLLFGVGMGRRPFLSAFSSVAAAGLERAEHSHSLSSSGCCFPPGSGGFSPWFSCS